MSGPASQSIGRVLWRGAPERTRGLLAHADLVTPGVAALVVFGVALMRPPDQVFRFLAGLMFVGALAKSFSTALAVRPPPRPRYTLTARQFVVESEYGRHGYDLRQLTRLGIQRHWVGRQTITFRRSGAASTRYPTPGSVLAEGLSDAPAVVALINEARAALDEEPQSTPTYSDDSFSAIARFSADARPPSPARSRCSSPE